MADAPELDASLNDTLGSAFRMPVSFIPLGPALGCVDSGMTSLPPGIRFGTSKGTQTVDVDGTGLSMSISVLIPGPVSVVFDPVLILAIL